MVIYLEARMLGLNSAQKCYQSPVRTQPVLNPAWLTTLHGAEMAQQDP